MISELGSSHGCRCPFKPVKIPLELKPISQFSIKSTSYNRFARPSSPRQPCPLCRCFLSCNAGWPNSPSLLLRLLNHRWCLRLSILMIMWCLRSLSWFDDRWLGLTSFPGFMVLEVDEVSPAQVVASVREGLVEDHRGRWKNLANNQAEAFLSAESQLIKFVLLIYPRGHQLEVY